MFFNREKSKGRGLRTPHLMSGDDEEESVKQGEKDLPGGQGERP